MNLGVVPTTSYQPSRALFGWEAGRTIHRGPRRAYIANGPRRLNRTGGRSMLAARRRGGISLTQARHRRHNRRGRAVSVRLLGKAFYTDLPTHLKLTLLALCDEANDEGRGVFIGQVRLAEKVGCVERSVRRNLEALREQGWITRLDVKSAYGTDQYEIAVEKLPDRPPVRPDILSGRTPGPDTHDTADRTPTSASTGHPLPPTREIPVRDTPEELAPRKRDAIWDVLVEVYGEPTSSGRGARNAAAKVLRDYGADPDEIRGFVSSVAGSDREWAVTTPTALAKHYGSRGALTAQATNGHGTKAAERGRQIRELLGGGRG